MIIDCHGHYTTVPAEMETYRKQQISDVENARPLHMGTVPISDDQIRESLEGAQLKLQRERGSDVTFFSPRASAMAHHLGNAEANIYWAAHWNDLIYRVGQLYPENFVPVGMLPQFPGVEPKECIAELERCVNELGFIGVNLNPDPSGGMWTDPPLFDKWWFPIFEKLCELDIPAMIHVSQTCNPNFHFTGAHYINADTTAIMQCIQSGLFEQFPTLKFLIPHGGGAVPYHWGRYRGLAQDNGWGDLKERILKNIYMDTCVYHQPGIDLLFKVIPHENILFASEMVGAVRGIDPETGQFFDDTKRYIEAAPALTAADRHKIFEENSRAVFKRMKAKKA
jgi:4-oxalmesaconate hydratase